MRRQARGLIGAETLTDNGLTGAGVKILVVDQGVNQHHINKLGGDFGGGFKWIADGDVKIPGQADIPFLKAEREHGSLMARSLISLAPDAEIWDSPLIPRQIDNISSFTLGAAFAYQIVRFITLFIPGPWVIVNAWGIDSRFDEAIWGDYSNNKNHPLNVQIGLAGQKHDIVFAAGNSGQFGPDPQAGPYDRGPGRSIFGANGHADVTSVGAVRTDAVWIGASSQGPGPSELAGDDCGDNEKPDLCAPGWFLEDRDSALRNGGTSTASAIVAGVLGALRQIHSPAAISPAEIRAALCSSARKFGHTGWNGRMGEGVLNVPGAVDALKECGGHDAKPVS